MVIPLTHVCFGEMMGGTEACDESVLSNAAMRAGAKLGHSAPRKRSAAAE